MPIVFPQIFEFHQFGVAIGQSHGFLVRSPPHPRAVGITLFIATSGQWFVQGREGQIKTPLTLAYSFKVPIQFPPGNAEVSTPACRLFSLAYMKLPRANCFTLFRQWVRCAFNFTLLTAVSSRAARIPMWQPSRAIR